MATNEGLFYLSSLKDAEDLKAIVIERWGFYPPQVELVVYELEDEVKKRVDKLEIVGELQNFKVIYFKLNEKKRDETQTIGQFLRSTSRGVINGFPKDQRQSNLYVFSDSDGNNWHFIAAEAGTGTLRLKRFVITPDNRDKLRTPSTQLDRLTIETADTMQTVISKLEEAFSVESVSVQFFEEYKKKVFDSLKKSLYRENQAAGKENAHKFTHQLLNRLMFLYFVQKKGVFGDDKQFMRTFWNAYRDNYEGRNEFYEKWLKLLFFEALNKPSHTFRSRNYLQLSGNYPDFNKILNEEAPYLNGGLFTGNELDWLDYKLPDKEFVRIFDFLESYNFTIEENTPLDIDLSIDPEMLGNIYEILVNVTEEEDEQREAGIFYTPKLEIELMVRRSLVEYLDVKTGLNKEKLYTFVLPELEQGKDPNFSSSEIETLLKELDELTLLDPACGSGHYLVVAAQIIWELKEFLYKQQGKKIDKFAEKTKIIENSIYGVDIKEWATEIAKLRLWLDLFVDADKEKLRSFEPLLPRLAFKIRVGDSLVQEIGDIYFSPQQTRGLSPSLRAMLSKIKEDKRKYFHNDPYADENRIKGEEIDFYTAILDEKINKLKDEINKIEQPLIEQFYEQIELVSRGEEFKQEKIPLEIEKQKKELEGQIDEIKKQKRQLDKKSKNFAFWPIEFADVFADKGGFDIVIANPPYVRQEKIKNPIDEDDRNYKEELELQLRHDWNDDKGNLIKLSKRSDLYVYFFLKGLALLNKNGVMCFISSNSWLDVGYGANLQEILLKRVPVIAIYDNQAKRSFKHADVNTVISVFRSPVSREWDNELKDNIIRFVNFKKPFEEVLYSDVFIELENQQKRTSTDLYAIHPIKQLELFEDGAETEVSKDKDAKTAFDRSFGVYKGNKWGGKYLRAPDIYWTILEKGKDKLVRLGDIAKIRRGFTTGANEFFYVEDVTDELED